MDFASEDFTCRSAMGPPPRFGEASGRGDLERNFLKEAFRWRQGAVSWSRCCRDHCLVVLLWSCKEQICSLQSVLHIQPAWVLSAQVPACPMPHAI